MKKKSLNELKSKCESCIDCELHEKRTNIVFADGNPDAKVLLIGEAPGKDEDEQGRPFVGKAGKLLDKLLLEANIDRKKDLYIINTLKCRPTEAGVGNSTRVKNRKPSRREKETCRHFLLSQIEIIDPKIILLCGTTALESFVEKPSPITKIRGEIFELEIAPSSQPSPRSVEGVSDSQKFLKYKAMPILHPSWLARDLSMAPNSRCALTLEDLKRIKSNYIM